MDLKQQDGRTGRQGVCYLFLGPVIASASLISAH